MNRLFVTSLFILLLGGPTCAQEAAPSDAQLKTPASAMPAQAAAPQPQAVANNGAQFAGDPCPSPQGALNNTPDDLAKVQEEIDRFTLCVQRAQLLERLNESALKNQETNDSALGFAPLPGGMGMAPGIAGPQGPAGLAPLPAAALAGADVSPLTQANAGSATALSAGAASEGASATPAEDAKPAAEEKPKPWTIREIYGSGSDVQARLVSPEGDEVKARNGMKLPDGKTVVVRITPAGVTVRDGSGAKTLEWAKS